MSRIIAQRKGLIAVVKNEKEAKTALSILEKGVDGVLLNTTDLNIIKNSLIA